MTTLRRICLGLSLLTGIIFAAAQGPSWGQVGLPLVGWFALVWWPLRFLRKTARPHRSLVAVALGTTISIAVGFLTMPMAGQEYSLCLIRQEPNCPRLVPMVKLITGQLTRTDLWDQISIAAMFVAALMSAATWVLVKRQVSRSGGLDLGEFEDVAYEGLIAPPMAPTSSSDGPGSESNDGGRG